MFKQSAITAGRARWLLVSAAVLTLAAASAASAASGAAEYQGRTELDFLQTDGRGTASPSATRVADETRSLAAATGRVRLALRPVQVATGGRVFISSQVPADLDAEDLRIDIFLREEGRWVPRRTFVRKAGKVGRVSLTLVVPDLEPGPVVAAVYAEPAATDLDARHLSAVLTIPKSARLRFAYTIDRIGWKGMVPVDVSVGLEVLEAGQAVGSRFRLLDKHIDPSKTEPQWFDEDLDLRRFAGRQVRFEFRVRQPADVRRLPVRVAWTKPAIVYPSRAKPKTSVVLISVDGLRARSMSCCGNTRATSPFVDQLFGRQGVIFDRAVAQAVTSTASHMSLMTSLYPSVHRVLNVRRGLAKNVRTLAQAFRRAGYATAAFTGGGTVPAEVGFARGFDVYYEDPERYLGNPHGITDATLRKSLDWLDKNRGAPVFLFIHLNQVRRPWVPPEGYLELFKDSRLEQDGKVDQGALVRYEREIRYVNDRLKDFVPKLDAKFDPRTTILVLTSPNGTEFGEHGAVGIGTHLYDESVRVPLMMRGANLRASLRYGETIGLIDVMPTLLDLVGLPVGSDGQGQSVAGSLRSGLPFEIPPRFTEAWGTARRRRDGQTKPWRPPAYAMDQDQHKLIMYARADPPVFEAYDLSADPRETTDLMKGGKGPDWAMRMKQVLTNYPLACKQVARSVRKAPEISYEARVKLQALGYGQ